MRPGLAIIVLWVLWAISWLLAAGWTAETQKQETLRAQLGYRSFLVLGAAVLGIPAHGYSGALRLWQVDRLQAWLCVGVIAGGIVFAWWARIGMGRLWSGRITRKAAHVVLDSGAFAVVRHPIYFGILLAVYATAAAKGTLWGIVGAVLVSIGIFVKARLEERWLTTELGEPYQAYRRRVPMLFPFWHRRVG
jgi:protein-S-isoprenylcysteine O-methyltransferase Ste14